MSAEATTPTRLGIIGTGLAIEKLHWPALRRLDGAFEIVGFCDRDQSAAEHFATYSGTPIAAYVPDYRDLLRRGDVEAVLIALPIPLLYAAARDALEAGKHVICEKPPGVDEAEAHAFLALADKYADRRLLIAENSFYRDDLRVARSLLDAGAVGRVHLMAWRWVTRNVPQPGRFSSTLWRQRTQYRGGAHLDAGVHHMAQIRLLCGDPIRAHGEIQHANRTIDGPSDLALNLCFVSGAVGSYAASYPEIAVPREANEMRIYGTDGVLVLGGGIETRTVEVHRADGEGEAHIFTGIDGGYLAELLNFREALLAAAPLVGTVEQSVKNLLLVQRGLDSAEQGAVVSFEDVPGGLSADSVPLWKPAHAVDLLDGLPGSHTVERIPSQRSTTVART